MLCPFSLPLGFLLSLLGFLLLFSHLCLRPYVSSGNWVPEASLMSHVTLSKLLSLSEPQFLYLENRDEYALGFPWWSSG